MIYSGTRVGLTRCTSVDPILTPLRPMANACKFGSNPLKDREPRGAGDHRGCSKSRRQRARGGATMAVTKQLSVMIENKRGALAEVCSKLAEKAVNILGLFVPEQPGMAPVRLVVNNFDTAKKTVEALGLKYSEEEVLSVHLSDRPGALGKITRKL